MADKSISELAAASQVGSTDLFVLEQGNVAKKLTGQILENWLVSMADGHGGIQTIEKTGTSGNTDTYTITFADETTSQFTVNNGNGITGMTSSKSGRITTVTFSYSDGTSSSFTISDGEGISKVVSYWAISTSKTTQPSSWQTTPQDMTSTYKYLWSYMRINYTDGTHQDTTPAVVGIYGDKGDPGNTGTSITNVAKISTSGLVDTYRITFSNGTNTTFQVTNGSNIETIELTSTSGLVDTYTVTMTNGATSTFQVTNGKGISSIQMVSGSHAAGTSDTYRITYNDGDTFDFLVYNGANGTGAVSTVAGIGVSGDTGDVPLILWGNSAPTSATVGQLKQLYFDLSGGVMYICVGVAVGSYSWVSMGITVDSALSTTSNNPVRNSVISQKVGTESLDGFTATNLTAAANELMTKKSEKSATVSSITYDSTNHRLRRTVNGTVSTVMDVDTEPTEGSMNPITSDAAADLKGSLTSLNNKFPTTICNSLSDFITVVTANPDDTIGMVSGAMGLTEALHGGNANSTVLYKYFSQKNRIVYMCSTLDNVVCGFVNVTGNVAYAGLNINATLKNIYGFKNSTANLLTVGEKGEYATIQGACDAASAGDIILVMPGIYTEQVSIFGKKLHIIGVDKKLCTIIDHSGNYNTPPVEMNIGTLANFTIIEDASEMESGNTDLAYCIHNDSPDNVDGETLEIANCDLFNARHSCIGFGLYPNYTVYIHDCYMRKDSIDTGEYKYGCLYVHGCTQDNSENQNLIVENCTISSAGDYAARVGIPGTGSGEVNARFIGNKMWSDINGSSDSAAVISTRNNYPFTLDKSCSGNTIEAFNIAPNYKIGSEVDLSDYGQGTYFTIPTDGYVVCNAQANSGVIYRIYGKTNSPFIYVTVPQDLSLPVFVRKNMRIEIRSLYGGATVTYYPLNNI